MAAPESATTAANERRAERLAEEDREREHEGNERVAIAATVADRRHSSKRTGRASGTPARGDEPVAEQRGGDSRNDHAEQQKRHGQHNRRG